MKYQIPGDTRVGVKALDNGLTHFFRPESGDPLYWISMCKTKVIPYLSEGMVQGFAFDENKLSFAGKSEPAVMENVCEKCREAYKALWKPN